MSARPDPSDESKRDPRSRRPRGSAASAAPAGGSPADMDIAALAARFGTPAYLYSAAAIRRAYARLAQALPQRVRVHYSIKANPSLAVCALLRSLGAGAEIASDGEQCLAEAAGFQPADIVFAGPGKTDLELERAVRARVGALNIESAHELERLEKLAGSIGGDQPVRVCLRVNPALGSSSSKIKTGGGAQKFGIDADRCGPVLERLARSKVLAFEGFHVFTGSQVLVVEELLDAAAETLRLALELSAPLGLEPPTINFGGGLGVPHCASDEPLDIERWGRGIAALIDRHATHGALARTRFLVEPGRYLVSEAGVYVARVLDVKQSGGERFAILDGGINHALLPITANSYRALLVPGPGRADDQGGAVSGAVDGDVEGAARGAAPSADEVLVGGPLCTSADLSAARIALPGVAPGDLVALANSGAYGLSASMVLFLSRAWPAEVWIDDGVAQVVRERTRPEEVLRGQHLPTGLRAGQVPDMGPGTEPGARR